MLKITAFYTALLALFYVFLTLRVVKLRRKNKVSIGDKGYEPLHIAIRIHGNFSEYIPIAIILLAISESLSPHTTNNTYFLNACGALLLLGRILHFIGLTRVNGKSFGRFFGTAFTLLTIITMAIRLLFLI